MSIEKAYNSWSDQYDIANNKTRDLDQKATIETLKKYPFDDVLELGCGTGKNTEWLIQSAKTIVGLDFSQGMLDIAIEKINHPNISFKKADLNLNWEIKNESVDLITSSLTLEHINDLNHIFEQASFKLKQDGLFFICEYHPFKQYLGKKARYESNGKIIKINAYTHHISEYIEESEKFNFKLIEIKEWFDEASEIEVPRLISFVFKKAETNNFSCVYL